MWEEAIVKLSIMTRFVLAINHGPVLPVKLVIVGTMVGVVKHEKLYNLKKTIIFIILSYGTCDIQVINGVTAVNCICDDGYIGLFCDRENCNGNGDWDGSSCDCNSGYTGDECDEYVGVTTEAVTATEEATTINGINTVAFSSLIIFAAINL